MYNPNSGYGRALLDAVASHVPAFGRILVVKNGTSDSADASYSDLSEIFREAASASSPGAGGRIQFFSGTTALSDAYDEAYTNNNDVIVLDAHTSHKVASMLTVSKNRIHFMGFDGGGQRIENQRTLVSNSGAGAASDTAMVKVTGVGCTFRNIAFKNNWTVTQNVYCVDDQGDNLYFENCTFHNLGSAHLTNEASAELRLSGRDNVYVRCQIGADTLKHTSTAGQVVLVKKQTNAATRVKFVDCYFRTYTNDTTRVFVRVAANGDIDRSITFVRPIFDNFNWDASNGGALLAVCVATPSGLVSGGINMFDVMSNGKGATDIATAGVGNKGVWITGVSPTAGTAGISVQATA